MSCCGPEPERPEAVAGRPEPERPEAANQGRSVAEVVAGRVPHDPPAEVVETLAAQAPADLTLVGLSGGAFRMGCDDPSAYPDDGEGPVREVSVVPFAISPTTVTNAQFAAFVLATGHRTDAEIHGDSFVFAGLLAPSDQAGVDRVHEAPWWCRVPGASWFAPFGQGSSAADRADHPVVHVSFRDATAYARWVGARLPSEAEWEFAARGGLDGQPYPWGAVREPSGRPRMQTFHGVFPDAPNQPVGTVPVTWYPPNGFGLHNMTGNVWEWTSDSFRTRGPSAPDSRSGCADAPTAGPDTQVALRGGSYLCHASYCRRYRTSARTGASPDSSLGHTGFRIAAGR